MSDPVVTTTSGAVRGRWRRVHGTPSAAFLGVPYAEAPIGALRFAAPRRREPWDGVRDAGTAGPTAQVTPLVEVTTIPEPSTPGDDVLNLNVFTPAPGDRGAGLPVLVWVHGGGYMAGCQNSPWYDGAAFNRDGVVTVSIGYRLGVEGWMRVAGAPDNRGALDWVAALTWVRENIAAFGGDPSRVTVAGQSAGGGAVLTLLTMASARGLVDRAVSISGALGSDESPDGADRLAAEFTALTGIPATADALADVDKEVIEDALRSLSVGPDGRFAIRFTPFGDGSVIPGPVSATLAAGAGNDIPLLLGATRHEFNQAGAGFPDDLPVEAVRRVLAGLGVPDRWATARLDAHSGPWGPVIGQAITDVTFRSLAMRVAQSRSATASSRTWLYEFDLPASRGPGRGLAFHCADLPYWWDHLDADQVVDFAGDRPAQHLATAMHSALVSFIGGGSPGWDPSDGHVAMSWDESPSAERDPFADIRAGWGDAPSSQERAATPQPT